MTRPTLVSLAEELGVSRQTVSNVVNQPHLVRESTRLRVQAAIEASGYRPSAAAQALRKQKSHTLGLRLYPSTDGINGAVMDRFLHCVVEQAESLGHRVMLFTASDDEHEVEALVDLVERNTIDAGILTSTTTDDRRIAGLEQAGVTFGAFGRPWGAEHTATHLWTDVDGRAGVRMATEHLVARGLGRVGFIGWPEGSGTGDDRFAGWLDAVTSLLPDLDTEAAVVRVDDGIAAGVAAMSELAARGFDAAVCASDSLAVGAMEVLRRGREAAFVPVIGFDDTPVARAVGLSSIAQPVEDAATLLVHQVVATATGTIAEPGGVPASVPSGSHGHLLEPTVNLRRFKPVDLDEAAI